MNGKYRKPWLILLASALAFVLMFPSAVVQAQQDTGGGGVDSLDETQRNSIAMLNYLTVLTQEINASANSRLYLESAYSSLLNNTYPNAVDSRTLTQLNSLLDTLENYRMVAVKRERLQYIYEQNRAKGIRAALPNPVSQLGMIVSMNPAKMVASLAYMAFDAYTSYTTYTNETDLQYLREGWVLDDEAAYTLHNSRKDTFSYMVRVVGEYSLPGDFALNENSVDEFVQWRRNTNVVQRIRFLESNQETYPALGAYWLVLAQSYYENGDYRKCLDAVATYQELASRIYRKDYELAKILPAAIVAAENVLDDAAYASTAARFADEILANTDNNEWTLRVFAAQTYIGLYVRDKNPGHLQKAFDIVLDNVNDLANEQKAMNAAFLAEVHEEPVPKGASKEEKAEIEAYNKQIREERMTALVPVYEPLLLNCDLLFFLAKEMNIPDDEKTRIDGILHDNSGPLFLLPALDAQYWFAATGPLAEDKDIDLVFNGKEIILPAIHVSSDAAITVTITVTITEPGNDAPVLLTDWVIRNVDRKDKDDYTKYLATYGSATADKHEYVADSSILIDIVPRTDSPVGHRRFSFLTSEVEKDWWEVVKVWEGNIAFIRNAE